MTYGVGSVTAIETAKGIRYRVRIPDGRGKHRSLGVYESEERAHEMREAGLVAAAELGTLSGVSFLAFGERWLERCKESGMRDVTSMRSRWSTIVALAPFAKLAVGSITRSHIRDWARTLTQQPAMRSVKRNGVRERVEAGRTLSWLSAKHALSLVGRALDEAREEGLVKENVARGVKLPRREQTKEAWTWLTVDEIAKVLAVELTEEQRAAITVSVYEGLRLGELAALQWENVDLESERPSMLIAASWKRGTKSGKVRRIPLLEPARLALKRWQEHSQRKEGLVFPSPSGGIYAKGHDWNWRGGYYRSVKGDLKRRDGVLERSGIKRRVRWHDLRHTCAANLVSGSWDRAWRLEEVRAFLGHSSITTTEIYAHLAPDALHATARQTAVLPQARKPTRRPQPVMNLSRRRRLSQRITAKSLARSAGFEPATFGSVDRCSIQLSYDRIQGCAS